MLNVGMRPIKSKLVPAGLLNACFLGLSLSRTVTVNLKKVNMCSTTNLPTFVLGLNIYRWHGFRKRVKMKSSTFNVDFVYVKSLVF
jgi:hypothetical protein